MDGSRSQVVSGPVRGRMGGGSNGVGNAEDGPDAPARAAAPQPAATREGFNNGDINNVWNHGTKNSGQGFKCGYCHVTNGGGGATRLRDHLAGIVGEVKSCRSVPRVVRDAMRELCQKSIDEKREKELRRLRLEQDLLQGARGENSVIDLATDEEGDIRMEIRKSLRGKNLAHAIERRGGGGKPVRVSVGRKIITAFFDKDLARSKAPVQPRIDTALLKGSREQLGQAWAKWFHANDIAGLKADCPYFRNTIKLTQDDNSAGINSGDHVETSQRSEDNDDANGRRSRRLHQKRMKVQTLYQRE